MWYYIQLSWTWKSWQRWAIPAWMIAETGGGRRCDQPLEYHPLRLGGAAAVVAASYFPSIIEIGVALGIVTYALLGFTVGARYLAIYPRTDKL